MGDFCHLHCHTQYSLLDGLSAIDKMIAKAVGDGQTAVAMTDHGNMYGAFNFVAEAKKQGIKPIIGCEFYVVADMSKKQFTRDQKDKRYHQLILAKNEIGYRNLSKLCSAGFTEGVYSGFPRIDVALLKQHTEGLIATSCCIGAMVPQAIINDGEEKAEKVFLEWLEMFGEDYFLELQRHNINNIDGTGVDQEDINQLLIKWSKKYNVPLIATNDSHYVDREDSNLHDILLCINTGSLQSQPKGHGKGLRFGFENDEFFFKSTAEMKQLFSDVPQAVENTMLVADRIEELSLARDLALPLFRLPEGFKSQDEYLRFITYEGAKTRYGVLTPEIDQRLNYELGVIKEQGFPGYFLIVQDFTSVARDMGVRVGPGRGSAAGSAVAYCTGITNVDPIKYGLLFERFLNPERVSMPDIDIDFDDAGRSKIIDYVVEKYGKEQVAQIVTYSKMAAKSAIRDVGRVLDIPLNTVNRVCAEFPKNLKANLQGILDPQGISPKLKKALNKDDEARAIKFRKIAAAKDETGDTVRFAKDLEGTVRNTGVHACGIIISPDEMTNYVPVSVAKDSDLMLTQFDNRVMEQVGLLKMDFLGLRNLTIIKDATDLIKDIRGIDIDIDLIPLDDAKTYELFSNGETDGVFQFESAGMQKNLKALKPDQFTDLIAMNALYRPGPMKYIQNYVDRKHGKEKVSYDLDIMEDVLRETYGITVYQEQVMLLSQQMAGFSGGQADILRKAMGKKKIKEMEELYPKFLEGCAEKNLAEEQVNKVWEDWKDFAEYAFNKSHATCYALVAYQTAYLKANYPAEYMASLLTNNMGDPKKVTQFMKEARRMGLEVMGPDVNESYRRFTVVGDNVIRFGLVAIKGLGSSAAKSLIEERIDGGPYESIFDLCSRVDLKSVNKKALEVLALSGSLDALNDGNRAQYFYQRPGEHSNTLEKAVKFGQRTQSLKDAPQQSLFGAGDEVAMPQPEMPECEEWTLLEMLRQEKQVTGIYISGHPLDDYQDEIQHFCTHYVSEVQDVKGRKLRVAGILSDVSVRTDKKGRDYARFSLQDATGSFETALFSEAYLKFRHFLEEGKMLYIVGAMEPRYFDPNQFDFKIHEISLLQEVIKKYLQRVCIRLSLENLTEGLIDDLEKILAANKGEHRVHFEIEQPEEKMMVKMYTRDIKIDVDEAVLNELRQMTELEYFLDGVKNNLARRKPEDSPAIEIEEEFLEELVEEIE